MSIPNSDFHHGLLSEAWVDCRTGLYHYRIKVAVPVSPLAAIPEFTKRFESQGGDAVFKRFQDALRDKGRIVIEVPGDLRALFGKNWDPEGWRKVMSENSEVLKLLDQESADLLTVLAGGVRVAPFESGDYRVSGDMNAVLGLLVRVFVRAADRSQRYQVVCVGAADSQRVSGAISYQGGADLLLPIGRSAIFKRNSVRNEIHSNRELSIVRGYGCAEVLERLFADVQDAKKAVVELRYGGVGEIAGAPVSRNRRVELTFQVITQ